MQISSEKMVYLKKTTNFYLGVYLPALLYAPKQAATINTHWENPQEQVLCAFIGFFNSIGL